jgi:hypothetical protein
MPEPDAVAELTAEQQETIRKLPPLDIRPFHETDADQIRQLVADSTPLFNDSKTH